MNIKDLQEKIEAVWENRHLLSDEATMKAIDAIIDLLDRGELRVATPSDKGWQVHEWVKKAVILYFPFRKMETKEVGIFEYYDKIPLKHNYEDKGVRVVPPATARRGAYLAPGVVLMPSYVNIGAYVDSGTMVDTWATVGSCAQVGKNVHISGGVGIGGVLEPLQAAPVVIEDGAFLGSRSIIVEGVRVKPVEYKGYVPARSVVIPGSYTKQFPAGAYQVPCALIIGQRKASTDLKTSLNEALRDFNVAV